MEEREKKEYDRIVKNDKNWRLLNEVGGKAALCFSLLFMAMGVYLIVQRLPISTPGSEEVTQIFLLWCVTFILLAFSTFLTGTTILSYCKDISLLLSLCGERSERVDPGQSPGESSASPGER
ncbi:MAG: hypothetical protein RDV48_07385 [Candidatus Eremiobacteraeota bacterium]|nr:hypothetical protein [Candidatus Eremiobacteraeota bacterium]